MIPFGFEIITKEDAANAESRYLVMATKYGVIKKTELSAFDNIRKGGLIAQNLREGDELIGVLLSGGDDEFMLGTKKGASIRFNENDGSREKRWVLPPLHLHILQTMTSPSPFKCRLWMKTLSQQGVSLSTMDFIRIR